VTPNTSSSLYAYWEQEHGDGSLTRATLTDAYRLLHQLPIPYRLLVQPKFMSAAVGVFLSLGFVLACLRFRRGTRKWLEIQVICATPCLLLIICDALSVYPMTARTSLFLVPAVVLIMMCNLQLIINFVLHRARQEVLRPIVDIALVCMTLLIACVGIARQPTGALSVPEEDVASSFSFLRANVDAEDLLWVHASCSESFKLYKKILGWGGASVEFGNTGWPCCPRGVPAIKGSGREADVRRDLNNAVPVNFSGKVWLLYTKRSAHWQFVGIDESHIAQSVFRERGCRQESTPLFHNIGVSLFSCKPAS
jgi:hypothetical protein